MAGRKVFQAAEILYAADVNNYLMDQSVMVFADSTARSTAIPTPTEGMTTYLEDTNKLEVWTGAAWTDINDNSAAIPKSVVTTTGDLIVANGNASVTRLGIGTNGQVLSSNGTTATWTTLASGADTQWSELATTTISGTTTTISSLPPKDKLIIEFQNVQPSAAAADYSIRINGDTGTNYNYLGGYFAVYTAAPDFRPNTMANSNNQLYVGKSSSASPNLTFNGFIVLSGCKTANPKLGQVHTVAHYGSGTNAQSYVGRFCWNNTATINSVSIIGSVSLNSGEFRIWGA